MKREKKAVITIGLPACGKTTDRIKDYAVVCKDDIRFMLLNYKKTGRDFYEELENIVGKIERGIIIELCMRGYNIYIDECHVTKKERKNKIELLKRFGYEIKYIIYMNHAKAVKRNRKRKRTVSEKVMSRMVDDFDFPDSKELKEIKTIKIKGE